MVVRNGEKGNKDKALDQLTETIKEVADIHVTLHDRRLDFLRTKRKSSKLAKMNQVSPSMKGIISTE